MIPNQTNVEYEHKLLVSRLHPMVDKGYDLVYIEGVKLHYDRVNNLDYYTLTNPEITIVDGVRSTTHYIINDEKIMLTTMFWSTAIDPVDKMICSMWRSYNWDQYVIALNHLHKINLILDGFIIQSTILRREY